MIMKKTFLFLVIALCSIMGYAQNDSIGVYAYMDGTYKTIIPIHYQQIKIGAGKASNIFAGKTSNNRFSKQAKFKLYFGAVPINRIADCSTFSTSYSINDYGIGEFKVKKDSRLLATVRGSIFGMKSGTVASDNVNIQISTIRNGAYEITVTGKPGEYCIMLTRNGAGAYFGVYDFTLTE